MKYCSKCLMPDTRPSITFENDVCKACINYEKQKSTDWQQRQEEFEKLCKKYRGSNGNSYDCAIAVSSGKDSHFQVYIMKEVMKMNPVLLTVGNIEWTETGRKNLENLSDTFGCDIISLEPNRNVARKIARKAFAELGSPTWYLDALMYAFPVRMAIQLGIKLLVYGENINYTYGGKHDIDTPSAKLQMGNDVVKPVWEKWFEDGQISEKELTAAKHPSLEEIEQANLEPIYLSYFVPWDTHHNYEVAKRWGFRHLGHEHKKEGTIEDYNSIDTLGYLLNQFMKFPKYAHSSATEIGSRWIRAGFKTREELIPYVKERDGKLDQEIVNRFCEFTHMTPKEFWSTLDKWYNPEFFEQDKDGVWHEKFEVGKGIKSSYLKEK